MISMAAVSLITLCVVIYLSYQYKVNTGVLAIAAAFILGFFVFLPNNPEIPISAPLLRARAILSGWNSNLFLVIAAVTLLFSIARANGTLALISERAVGLVRGKKALLPIMMYLISFVVGGIGPGTIGATALLVPMAAAIAVDEGISILLMCAAVWCGVSGAMSSVTPTGIIGVNLAQVQGVALGEHQMFNMALGLFIMFWILYVLLGGWKSTKQGVSEESGNKNGVARKTVTRDQWLTLGVIVCLVVSTIVFRLDNGLCAFVGAAVLLVFGKIDEKTALNGVPWSALIMVCGVGVLVNVVGITGGIKMVTNFLATFTTESTAGAIFTLSSGAMSAVASASGVVMPTLIPPAVALAKQLSIDPVPLIVAVTYGSHLTAISPFSTGGALTLACAGDNVDKLKLFNQLLLLALCAVILGAALMFFHIVGYI
jgi:di/tricarboxylate transporter